MQYSCPSDEELPHIPGLAVAEAVARFGGNVSLFKKTLALVVEQVPGYLAEAEAAGDAALFRRHAHTIKGLAAAVGATDMAEASLCAERAVIESGLVPGPDVLDRLRSAVRAFQDATRGW